MKHRDFIIRKLELTTPEERQKEREFHLKSYVIFGIVIVTIAVIVSFTLYDVWLTLPHCIDSFNTPQICK